MWRGPAWVHVNYFVIRGLQRYGYAKEAETLRQKTLQAVADWYGRTGVLWEFYDPDGQTPPADLDRKGRLAAGSGLAPIGDYNVTAALYADLLMRPAP
jgi:neutral trehalase